MSGEKQGKISKDRVSIALCIVLRTRGVAVVSTWWEWSGLQEYLGVSTASAMSQFWSN